MSLAATEAECAAIPMPDVTIAQKRATIARELELRRNVYPRWVAANELDQVKADYEIAVMTAILADYDRLLALDRLPCDVHLPPVTIIRKGCSIETVLTGIAGRVEFPADAATFGKAENAHSMMADEWRANSGQRVFV